MDENRNVSRKKVINSLSWQMFNRAFSIVINFAVQVVLARLIEPKDFGSLAIITTVTGFAGIFVEAGISTSIVQRKNIDESDIFTVLVISLFTASLAYFILFVSAPLISDCYGVLNLTSPLRVLSISIFLNSINSVYTAVYIRNLEFKKLFIRSLVATPFSGAAGILLAFNNCGVWALVSSQLVNSFLTCIMLLCSSDVRLKCKFSFEKARQIYSFGGKILLTSVIASLYDTTRTMVIGLKYSGEDLAYYDRAYTYSMYVSQFINMSVSNVLLPLFSRKQDSRFELKNLSRRVTGLSSFCFFPLFMGLAGVAEPLIICVFGMKWRNLIPFFMVFCFLRMSGVVQNIDKQAFYSIGRSDIVLKYSAGSMILNLISLYIVLPYGVFAIALNRLAVELVAACWIMAISSKLTGYTVRNKFYDFRKPLINSMIMFLAVFLFSCVNIAKPLLLLMQIVMGIIIYIGLSLLTRDDNIQYIFEIIKEIMKENAKKNE